ncbi:RHS repeat protein, partial [Elizabethkingia miricola]|uniref:RHS repeat protein n=1 Tax=Elizabethkingia miricola TaxID=172045 RepID=UPI00140B32FD
KYYYLKELLIVTLTGDDLDYYKKTEFHFLREFHLGNQLFFWIADNTQGTDQSEQALVGALDILRNNTALSAYQITTYTYNPLIGVTSITPPSGVREIYKYDSANRLESVKDVNGNLLKEYQYRYKN